MSGYQNIIQDHRVLLVVRYALLESVENNHSEIGENDYILVQRKTIRAGRNYSFIAGRIYPNWRTRKREPDASIRLPLSMRPQTHTPITS